MLAEIRDRGIAIDDSQLQGDWQPDQLRSFAEGTLSVIGFDFQRGRLDLCKNAFCTTFATDDVRMTTRPSNHIKGVVSSSIHEMGHGLYEQHSNPAWDGTPLQGGVSLAVHESQSRTWENVVGRSRPFWRRVLGDLQGQISGLASLTPESMFQKMNRVEPTFIRVGADELTYNLHILIRFELEVALLTGALDVANLPEAWNDKYEQLLGIRPPTDAVGCLQDVHWSKASFGYFPTYTYGNLIGIQIWNKLTSEIANTDELIERGEFAPILEWLTANVYSVGRLYRPKDLLHRITGSAMSATPWIEYANAKYRSLYEL